MDLHKWEARTTISPTNRTKESFAQASDSPYTYRNAHENGEEDARIGSNASLVAQSTSLRLSSCYLVMHPFPLGSACTKPECTTSAQGIRVLASPEAKTRRSPPRSGVHRLCPMYSHNCKPFWLSSSPVCNAANRLLSCSPCKHSKVRIACPRCKQGCLPFLGPGGTSWPYLLSSTCAARRKEISPLGRLLRRSRTAGR
jgi:hypothetical protein